MSCIWHSAYRIALFLSKLSKKGPVHLHSIAAYKNAEADLRVISSGVDYQRSRISLTAEPAIPAMVFSSARGR